MLIGQEKIIRAKTNPRTGVYVKEIYNASLQGYYCRVVENSKESANMHLKPFEVLCRTYGCTEDAAI